MEEIAEKVKSSADIIAEALKKGYDVEIRLSRDGISIREVAKKVIVR